MRNNKIRKHTVDVVVPAHNAENYIRECLNSALSQTYHNIEIIVVDDGSVDNTRNILRNEYKDRIKLIIQNQSGPSRARNVGIQAGDGEFVAFLDSDDLWEPDFLERTVKFIENHLDLCFVFTENDVFDEGGVKTHHWIKDDGRVAKIPVKERSNDEIVFARRIWTDMAIGSFIPTSGILIRRHALEKVGLFDEGLTNAEDRDLFIRLAQQYDAGYIETCLSHKRQHPLGLCSNFEKVVIGSDVVSRRLLASNHIDFALRRKIKKHLGKQWYSLGRLFLDRNNPKLACQAFVKSLHICPDKATLCFFVLSATGLYWPLRAIKRHFEQ